MTAQIQTIGIAGAGAWGTALANAAAVAGNDVVLWMRSPEQAAALAATRSNERFLPGVTLHERIRADRRSRRISPPPAPSFSSRPRRRRGR